MKKMKKVFAMLLALAMVLGMSMVAFAANGEARIKISGIALPDEAKKIGNAEVEYAKIITPDPATQTGWKFVNDDYAQAYIDAYEVSDAQAAINALIAEGEKNGLTGNGATARLAISGASAKVPATNWKTGAQNVSTGSAEWSVSSEGPGIYIVRVSQTHYNYTAMAAYVGFGQMVATANGYEYPVMYDASLTAKGAPLVVDKTNGDPDAVVAVGDELTYTIETTVPYIESENLLSESYAVKDTITGAEYVLEGATIKYEDNKADVEDVEIEQGTGEAANTFILDLTSVLNEQNSNAGRTIVITYKAKVTEIDNITNTAKAGHVSGDDVTSDYGDDDDDVFTGELTITKKGEIPAGGTEDDRPLLGGAGFEVKKTADGEALKFTEVYVGSTAEPKVVDYYKYDPDGTVTTIMTGEDGVARIKGLDLGTYYFEEVVAPEGYSLNETDVTGVVKLVDGTDGKVTNDEQITYVGATMNDTKITSLPSTGGIGTTIFTIAGCLIMVVAAGLFFASRRKSAVK